MGFGNQGPMMYGMQGGYYQPQYQMPMQNPYAAQLQMNQQQMQQIQQAQQPQQIQAQINARMVKNRKEAEETQIGFDQALNVMINMQGDEIYVKRFNQQTGEDDFRLYKVAPWPEVREESRNTEQMLSGFEQRFKKLEDEIAELKTNGNRRRRAEEDA